MITGTLNLANSKSTILDGHVYLPDIVDTGVKTIEFNDDYTLTFTMTNGEKFTTGSIRGEKGEKGDKGDIGITPEISIGTVSVGEKPGVTVSGTPENPVLNFVFPRYVQGGLAIDDDYILYHRYSNE